VKRAIAAAAACLVAGLAFGSIGTVDAQPDAAAGQRAFLEIARVLQSPRCLNCHPAGDRPLRGDHAQPHAMNVSRKSPAAGLDCTACHREHNGPVPHSPPGVPRWRLPPIETPLVFQGKTPGEICRQMLDPAQNGKRSVADLEHHMGHDELVLWGWNPGPGRTLPPLSHDEFMTHVHAWIAAGTPCPP
jgi:hypothetical protein